jgi:hypothetical protein
LVAGRRYQLYTGAAKPGQTIACSCCPAYEYDENDLGEDGVPLVASQEAIKGNNKTTNIVVTEQVLTDGTILTEKTTTYPDGSESLETTSTKPRILKSSVAEDEKKEQAGGGVSDEGLDNKTANEA